LYAYGGTCIEAIGKINLNCKIINKNEHIIIHSMVIFVVIKEKFTLILGLKSSVELGLAKRIDMIKK